MIPVLSHSNQRARHRDRTCRRFRCSDAAGTTHLGLWVRRETSNHSFRSEEHDLRMLAVPVVRLLLSSPGSSVSPMASRSHTCNTVPLRDLNLWPLVCHAHISCSPPLSDVQISSNRSTFCPLIFAAECTNLLALLTALLTKCPCRVCKGSIKPPHSDVISSSYLRSLLTSLLTDSDRDPVQLIECGFSSRTRRNRSATKHWRLGPTSWNRSEGGSVNGDA